MPFFLPIEARVSRTLACVLLVLCLCLIQSCTPFHAVLHDLPTVEFVNARATPGPSISHPCNRYFAGLAVLVKEGGLFLEGRIDVNGCHLKKGDFVYVWSRKKIKTINAVEKIFRYKFTWRQAKFVEQTESNSITVSFVGAFTTTQISPIARVYPVSPFIRVQITSPPWQSATEVPPNVQRFAAPTVLELSEGKFPSLDQISHIYQSNGLLVSEIDEERLSSGLLSGRNRIRSTRTETFMGWYRMNKLTVSHDKFFTWCLMSICFRKTMDPKTNPPLPNGAAANNVRPPVDLCGELVSKLCPHSFSTDAKAYAACGYIWNLVGGLRFDSTDGSIDRWATSRDIVPPLRLTAVDLLKDTFSFVGVAWNTFLPCPPQTLVIPTIKPNTGAYFQYVNANGDTVIVVHATTHIFSTKAMGFVKPTSRPSTHHHNIHPTMRVPDYPEYLTVPGVLRLCHLVFRSTSPNEVMETKTLHQCRETMGRVCDNEAIQDIERRREVSELCRFLVQKTAIQATKRIQSEDRFSQIVYRPIDFDAMQLLEAVVTTFTGKGTTLLKRFGENGNNGLPTMETDSTTTTEAFVFDDATGRLTTVPSQKNQFRYQYLQQPLSQQTQIIQNIVSHWIPSSESTEKTLLATFVSRGGGGVGVIPAGSLYGENSMTRGFRIKLGKLLGNVINNFVDKEIDGDVIQKQVTQTFNALLVAALAGTTAVIENGVRYRVTTAITDTKDARDEYVCGVIMAFRNVGAPYSKYERVANFVGELLAEAVGFKVFRKRTVWNRCTEKHWYHIPILEAPADGLLPGSVIDVAWFLHRLTINDKHYNRVKKKEHLCFIHVSATRPFASQDDFEDAVMEACTELVDECTIDSMEEHQKSDPNLRAGYSNILRKGYDQKETTQVAQDEIPLQNNRWGVMLYLGKMASPNSVGVIDAESCRTQSNAFFNKFGDFKNRHLLLRSVSNVVVVMNCDAACMWKRSYDSSVTTCSTKVPYGGELLYHSSYGTFAVLVFVGDDSREQILGKSAEGASSHLVIILIPVATASSPCSYAKAQSGIALNCQAKELKLGPRNVDKCVLGPTTNVFGAGQQATAIVSFSKMDDAWTVVKTLGPAVARFVIVGRDVIKDTAQLCRNPFPVSNAIDSTPDGIGSVLLFCGVNAPDSKHGYAVRAMASGALGARPCTICPHGNGNNKKVTNIGVHSSEREPPDYADTVNMEDQLRCLTMELVTLGKILGHQMVTEKAVFFLRKETLEPFFSAILVIEEALGKDFKKPTMEGVELDDVGNGLTGDDAEDAEEEEVDEENDPVDPVDPDVDPFHWDGEDEDDPILFDEGNEIQNEIDDPNDDNLVEEDEDEDEDEEVAIARRKKELKRRTKEWKLNQKQFLRNAKTLQTRLNHMDKKTVKSDGPPGIDVQLKGGQLVLSPVKKMFAACAKKVKAKCYLNGMRTEVTNELVKECFAAVKNFKQDLQPLLNKIFDGTWVDSDTHRKTKIRLAIQIEQHLIPFVHKFEQIFDKLLAVSARTVNRHHASTDIEWDGVFQLLKITSTDAQTKEMKKELVKVKNLKEKIHSISTKPKIEIKDLVSIIQDPFVLFTRDKASWKFVLDVVGKGRFGCYMYAETCPLVTCPLHVGINFVNRVLSGLYFFYADLIDMSFPQCQPDSVSDSTGLIFSHISARMYTEAKIKNKNKSRFSKGKDRSMGVDRNPPQALKQPHGCMTAAFHNINFSHSFPLGDQEANAVTIVTVDSKRDQTEGCPRLQWKLVALQDFTAAIYYVLTTIKPCDFFEDVVSLRGCVTQTTVPPSDDTALCKKQCAFITKIVGAARHLLDDLAPPFRNKYGSCHAHQTTSEHLYLVHLTKSYCANDCETQPSAHAAEAHHQIIKNCYFNTGRSPREKLARFTSQQQAHLCALGIASNSLENENWWKDENRKWKSRHKQDLKKGTLMVARAFESLWVFEECKNNNKEVFSSMLYDAAGVAVFTRTETDKQCLYHDDLHRVWKLRGTDEDRKKYDKTLADAGTCACVEFFLPDPLDDATLVLDTDFKSEWCTFQDRPVPNSGTANVPRQEAEEEVEFDGVDTLGLGDHDTDLCGDGTDNEEDDDDDDDDM